MKKKKKKQKGGKKGKTQKSHCLPLEDTGSPINYFENWLIQKELSSYPPFLIPAVSQGNQICLRSFFS